MTNVTMDEEYLKTLTLLYVEDDADCRTQISEFLRRSVGTLISAVNGAEGLDLFITHKPHIVVTDIIMPVMDGLSMTEAILKCDPSVPVVALTAFDDSRYLMRAINMGIEKYVTKPVESELLYNCLLACAHHLRLEEEAQRYYEHTECKLATSEQKFRNLFEYSRDACLLFYDGKFIECNQAAVENLHATSIADVINTSPDELSPEYQPDGMLSRDKVQIVVAKALETGTNRFEWIHRRLDDGVEFPVEVSLTRLPGEMIYVNWHDITERKRAEKKLSEEKNFIDQALNSLPDPFFVIDLEGKYLRWNSILETITGYKNEELAAMRSTDFFDDTDAANINRAIQNIVHGTEKKAIEAYLISKDGTRTPFEFNGSLLTDESGAPIAICGTGRNLSERKRAEKSLEESEKRYRDLIEKVPAMFYSYSTKQGGLFYSSQVEHVFGYPLQAFYDNPLLWRDSIHPDDFSAVETAITKISEGSERSFDIEYRVRNRAGELLWLRDSSYNQLVSDDEIVVHGFAREITHLKQAEEEKIKLEGQLRQSQKMDAIGQLAGGVAHDFNNMLGVILGYTEMALMDMDRKNPLHGNLQEIRNAASRSADLTRQLLAFARKQTIIPHVIDLNETVSAMLKMLQRLIGEQIQLTWEPAAILWQIKADPSQIDQILANLCVNARDAIDNTGRITIETRNNIIDADFCKDHRYAIPGEYVHLSVSDNGSGMDTETMAHIFEPFYTTKNVGEGTGLGLATIYGIVKQNNGFITVSSVPGEGTTFSIHLPRYKESAVQPAAKSEIAQLQRGQETILLVEDEPVILGMAVMMLEMQGYTVLPAGTPNEAIRLAELHNGEIRLLITDVVMPEMNGRELASRLLSINNGMKLIFMSGYSTDVIDRHGVLDEDMHFIQKPFSLSILSSKVREVLDNNHI